MMSSSPCIATNGLDLEGSWAIRGAKLSEAVFDLAPGDAGLGMVVGWLRSRWYVIKDLNVAGNRESPAPGIGDRTGAFLLRVFKLAEYARRSGIEGTPSEGLRIRSSPPPLRRAGEGPYPTRDHSCDESLAAGGVAGGGPA